MSAEIRAPERDLRLDFFRGLAMLIILLAHIPFNGWALWIPARFGFSDATEMFVFCSGMASAIAFGASFTKRGWWLGTARILFRVWQVYWAQIGMVLATIAVLYLIDRNDWGLEGKEYLKNVPVLPLFNRTGEALLGLFTLNWVPNYFDILPMYLVILAMIPAMMALHRFAGREAVFGAVIAIWIAAQFGLLDLPS
ncbi:MAG TPA: OpgC domain-containing protein, partial [Paracoccaceae bacterium]|nr:OpgC domain-containing protein [Paracoccaceae bacterium]